MKQILYMSILATLFAGCFANKSNAEEKKQSFYDFTAIDIKGNEVKMSDYKDSVVLVVNTASKCGFTPQFEGLQELHEKYKGQGLVILGFPSNQFGNQDPGSNQEIQEFCQINYGVTFRMFSKIEVNGENAHPLYQFLKTELPGSPGKGIKWNFTKFLIAKDGIPVKRFGSSVKPEKIAKDIERELSK